MAKKLETSQVKDVFVGMDYSNKLVALNAENRSLLYDDLDYTPRSIPLGQILGETTNDMIEKILLHSGAITRQQWENFKGISYDILDEADEAFNDDDFTDDVDDYTLSSYSKYDDVTESNTTESTTETTPPKAFNENEPPLPTMETTEAVTTQSSDTTTE